MPGCAPHASDAGSECYADYVNPFIGTDFTGNIYPGAQVPFGMVQLHPVAYQKQVQKLLVNEYGKMITIDG